MSPHRRAVGHHLPTSPTQRNPTQRTTHRDCNRHTNKRVIPTTDDPLAARRTCAMTTAWEWSEMNVCCGWMDRWMDGSIDRRMVHLMVNCDSRFDFERASVCGQTLLPTPHTTSSGSAIRMPLQQFLGELATFVGAFFFFCLGLFFFVVLGLR